MEKGENNVLSTSCPETWSNLIHWLKIRKTRNVSTDNVFVNRYGNPISIHGIEYIYNTIKREAGNGKIVLMHDIHTRSAKAIDEIIKYLLFLNISSPRFKETDSFCGLSL